MDILLTSIVIFILVFIVVSNAKIVDKPQFISSDMNQVLRGVSCIIVIIVHIPSKYGNPLQNLVGSFAYIGVTIFFFLSAYGCRYNIENKKNYLKSFWKKRLISLFFPVIILNLLNFIFSFLILQNFDMEKIFDINKYIWAIIVAYFIMWCVWSIDWISRKYKDVLVSVIVFSFSLVTYFTDFDIFFLWPMESLGFVLGIWGYRFKDIIASLLSNYKIKIIFLSFTTSILCGVLYLKEKNLFFWGGYLIRFILAISILVLIFAILNNFTFTRHRSLVYLGEISYNVYLGHLIVIDAIVEIFPNMSSGIFVCLVVLLSILLAILCRIVIRVLEGFLNKLCVLV